MKRKVQTILLCAMLVGLCACGRSRPPEPEPVASAASESSGEPVVDEVQVEEDAPVAEEDSSGGLAERLPPMPPSPDPMRAFHIAIKPLGASLVLTRKGKLVYEDDRVTDPEFILELEPGTYQVMVSMPGWKTLQQDIHVRPDTVGWSAQLEKLSGQLIVESEPGAEVQVLGPEGQTNAVAAVQKNGRSPAIALMENEYTVYVNQPDYFSLTNTVQIKTGKDTVLKMPLQAMPGQLRVGSGRPAEVWMEDVKLGVTGETISWIPPGMHRIAVKRRGFRTEYLEFRMPPNGYVTLAAPTLKPEGGALVVEAVSAAPDDTYMARCPVKVRLDEDEWQSVQLPYIVQELSCEEHAVSLRAPGYNIRENMPVMVGIEEDKTNRVQFTLIPMASELVISCNAEEAEVFEEEISLGIVGKVLRLTPFTEHQLEIRATGFSPVWLQVRLPEPGKLYRQHIELETASLFSDLIEIPHARPAPLSGLAPGSRAARERQADAMREWQLPLEVKTQRTGIRMRLVPAGTFTMGGREGDPGFREDEKIASEVTISRPMYVGKYEITQKQWERVMGRNPSSFMHAGPAAPVEQVSWEDARKFVKRLCDMESVPVGTYRLLTEAEWEYCCRAGTETPIYTGAMTVEGKNNAPELDVIAWYAGNSGVDYKGGQNSEDWPEKQYDHSRAGTHAVGQKKPNAWGLYDMIGNVWEWCFDRYNSDYLAVRQVDPRGPSFGNGRVCRGGGWYSNALKCRSARRYSNTPRYRSNHLGVRIAREVERIE